VNLRDHLLRGTSRSFYLSLRWLPGSVRDSIALGYLLARASDSIADASLAPLDRRVEALHALRDGDVGTRIIEELASHQTKPAEQELVQNLPGLLDDLERSPDQTALQAVWSKILEGQIFDLVRFVQRPDPLTPDELDEYTYLVAGSVGEFWSTLCTQRITDFSTMSAEPHKLLACNYGKGLQRVNILRDHRADTAAGRPYLGPGRFEVERATAQHQLNDGLEWVGAVRGGRMRLSAVLPASIALEMLPRFSETADAVKLSRRAIRRHLFTAVPILWSSRWQPTSAYITADGSCEASR
jgi:farnesyl-diphosphate farnesyltransferase